MTRHIAPAIWLAVAASMAMLPVTAAFAQTAQGPRETAVAPETNPPGDIPDNQVFIPYKASAGFSMPVPEGWARSAIDGGVRFADKYGAVDLVSMPITGAKTVDSVTQSEAVALETQGHAVKITKIRVMSLPAGDAVAIDYLSNSDVNAVTNRKIRLENRRIYYTHAGTEAVVTLSAPAGADNVDQWKMMAEAFRWSK